MTLLLLLLHHLYLLAPGLELLQLLLQHLLRLLHHQSPASEQRHCMTMM